VIKIEDSDGKKEIKPNIDLSQVKKEEADFFVLIQIEDEKDANLTSNLNPDLHHHNNINPIKVKEEEEEEEKLHRVKRHRGMVLRDDDD